VLEQGGIRKGGRDLLFFFLLLLHLFLLSLPLSQDQVQGLPLEEGFRGSVERKRKTPWRLDDLLGVREETPWKRERASG
jgi:hypothetical protein